MAPPPRAMAFPPRAMAGGLFRGANGTAAAAATARPEAAAQPGVKPVVNV